MADRDWWPFTRLLITSAAMGLAAHWAMGWKPRPEEILAASAQVLGVLSILAMISFVLADLYLLAFLLPLYALAVLNDWSYGMSLAICRFAFGLRPGPILALAGLCGEILLFAVAGLLARYLMLGL